MSEESVIVLVPIVNLDSPQDFIKLDDSLCIRRIGQKELDDLMQKSLDYYHMMEQALLNTKFVIEKKLSKEADIQLHWWTENSSNVRNILLALRLLGKYEFCVPTTFFISSSSFYISNNTPEPCRFNTTVSLSKEDIIEFTKLWQKIDRIEKGNGQQYLKFSLSQFNRSFDEPVGPADHDEVDLGPYLIDYVTAFESIVFHNEKNAPHPYGPVIGIAIGMLIGKNEAERVEIKRILKLAYEKRNTIVHGHLRKRTRL